MGTRARCGEAPVGELAGKVALFFLYSPLGEQYRSLEMTGTVMTLPRQTLRSTAYDLADALDVNELYQQKGWTDGLPIVPPTEERVVECLQAVGLAAADIVGVE